MKRGKCPPVGRCRVQLKAAQTDQWTCQNGDQTAEHIFLVFADFWLKNSYNFCYIKDLCVSHSPLVTYTLINGINFSIFKTGVLIIFVILF